MGGRYHQKYNHVKYHRQKAYGLLTACEISALQMSGKNRNRLESSLSLWTNPVYKTRLSISAR